MEYKNILYIKRGDNLETWIFGSKEEEMRHQTSKLSQIIEVIDYNDLYEFIVKLDSEDWVPNCYWKGDLGDGGMQWAVYSYLVSNEIVIIENKYWVGLGLYYNHPNEFLLRDSYYNILEHLYDLIIEKLVDEGYYRVKDTWFYELGCKPLREIKFNQLGIL